MATRVLLHKSEDIHLLSDHLIESDEVEFMVSPQVPPYEAWIYIKPPYLTFVICLERPN